MADDFAKTADRMMFDARTLHHAGAHRNACYLAGYVVECTLKALLEQAGLKPERTHSLESLHDEVAQLLVFGNAVVARYGDPASFAPTMLQQHSYLDHKGRFRDACHWDPEHRYDGSRWDSKPMSEQYLREASKSLDVIIQMIIDGVL